MRRIGFGSVFIVIILSLFFGCRGKLKNSEIVLSEDLQRLISSTPRTLIDIEQVPAKTIYPTDSICGVAQEKNRANGLYLGMPASFIVKKDTFYICDRANNYVLVVDRQGNPIRTIGRKGKGPSEFVMPTQIVASDSLILVYDFGNARVQVFSPTFEYRYSVVASFPPTGPSIFAASNKLFIRSRPRESNVIAAYNLNETIFPKYSFLPNPFAAYDASSIAMENVKFSGDGRGIICAAFVTLPYLFLFGEDGTPLHVIELKGRDVERIIRANSENQDTPRKVTFLFNSLRMTEEGSIGIIAGSSFYLISKNEGGYFLSKRLNLRSKPSTAGEDLAGIPISDFSIKGQTLYIADVGRSAILKFSME
jgi:hypothetical protein